MAITVEKSGSVSEADIKQAQIIRTESSWACEIMYDSGDGIKPLTVELSEEARSDLDSAWTNIKSELIGAANTAEGL